MLQLVLTYCTDDFFIGIGDINSSFLAKITPLTPSATATTPQQPEPPSGESAPSSTVDGADTAITVNALPDSPEISSPEEIDNAELEKKIMLSTNNAALDEQFEQRPLAKKQEELQGAIAHENSNTPSQESNSQPSGDENPAEDPSSHPHHPEKPKQALLKNDDRELDRIGKVSLRGVPRFTPY